MGRELSAPLGACLAGGRHLLMLGPLGSCKTMLAERLPTIFARRAH
jgi:predicted ATPase with chaperone activity